MTVKVTRAQVYAARTLVSLGDRRLWVLKLAALDLGEPKPKSRKECHGSRWICCQYCDTPQCNSNRDPHLLGRLAWRWNQRKEWRRHEDEDHTVPLKLLNVARGRTRWYKDPFRRKS